MSLSIVMGHESRTCQTRSSPLVSKWHFPGSAVNFQSLGCKCFGHGFCIEQQSHICNPWPILYPKRDYPTGCRLLLRPNQFCMLLTKRKIGSLIKSATGRRPRGANISNVYVLFRTAKTRVYRLTPVHGYIVIKPFRGSFLI